MHIRAKRRGPLQRCGSARSWAAHHVLTSYSPPTTPAAGIRLPGAEGREERTRNGEPPTAIRRRAAHRPEADVPLLPVGSIRHKRCGSLIHRSGDRRTHNHAELTPVHRARSPCTHVSAYRLPEPPRRAPSCRRRALRVAAAPAVCSASRRRSRTVPEPAAVARGRTASRLQDRPERQSQAIPASLARAFHRRASPPTPPRDPHLRATGPPQTGARHRPARTFLVPQHRPRRRQRQRHRPLRRPTRGHPGCFGCPGCSGCSGCSGRSLGRRPERRPQHRRRPARPPAPAPARPAHPATVADFAGLARSIAADRAAGRRSSATTPPPAGTTGCAPAPATRCGC